MITDFGGVHIVDKLVYDILSTEQSSGPKDLANSTSGTLIDILSTDWMMEGLTNELLRNAFKKLHNDVYSSHIPVDQAISNYRRESNFIQNYKKGIQAADLASTVLDLKGFYDATNELTNDCMSVADLKSDIETDQREMSKITNTILKNLALMDCIKETQDSLNHGGIGARRYSGTNESYAVKMILPFLIRSISENSENPFQPGIIATVMSPDRVQTWQIDTLKLRYTINQLKNLKSLLWQMLMKIEDDIWPSLASWMINQWSELKPPVIVQFLKKADAALKDFAGKESSIKNLEKSIRENLEASVTGYEVDHLSDQSGILSSVGYAMGKKMDLANAINAEKWISLPSEKISGEVGRVNMNFPSDVSWSIDVYSAGNKFVTNRSSSGKQKFEDVVPGYYTLKLNTVPVENVAIEKGKEIKLKVGFLNIVSGGHWELRNESKEKFYTSGNKPAKIALPVGIYQLNFDEKYYRIIVRDRVIVRFELQVPFSE